ncbi:hypothetical protein [Siccirubricoccus sp. G192]|uniref:hypothetical protein n=1 Tax=Siccirubricoccus sp. G192 TaxID=2849651 RepID=UPI001C2B78CD|nr:hypothetical protein [Siccirubricoccus sp. G192]MBV1798624.1 hypothetical protein [Siccirubricoccus sp. G192]
MPAAPCSSEILPFPIRPDDRLRRALRQLDLALAEQRQAVAGLRGELARLGEAVCGLDDSLGQFRGGARQHGGGSGTGRAGGAAA